VLSKHPAASAPSEIVGSEAFGRYVAQIWNDLREEANRGMRDEEQNALRQEEQAL
jgi:NitT/TauT family transport system ATP-binding protein